MNVELKALLTCWRDGSESLPGITEVFLAALGIHGEAGFQCELGFGNGDTKSFQSDTLHGAIHRAFEWTVFTYGPVKSTNS